MPLESRCWRIGFRKQHPLGHSRHINELELEAVVDAIRWLSRSREGAHRRVVLELDSLVVACALRKGRSSRAALSKHLRRLAALTLALDLHLEARWTPTSRNMADGPSRGRKLPSPCVEPPRPARDSGLSKKSRACEAGDGPPPWSFWSPLLEASARAQTFNIALQRWLALRLEALGAAILLCVSLLCVGARGRVPLGLSGLSLTYSMTLTNLAKYLVNYATRAEAHRPHRRLEYRNISNPAGSVRGRCNHRSVRGPCHC
mgnify:CR=1 FL=1